MYYNRLMPDRLLRAALAAIAGLVRAVWRAVRQLWHEVTGAFFLLFALVGGVSVWREWQRGSAAWLMAIVLMFTLTMGWFAVSAFLSARKVENGK